MGLDMYLTKRTFIGAEYKHRDVKGEVTLTTCGKPINIKLERISYIEESVAYWRKANHIHAWFVKHCQEGNDDCRTVNVSEEDLNKLLADCKAIKENPKVAEEAMPTQSGFFFGGTDYDESYFEDINYTINAIEGLIAEKGKKEYMDFEVQYSSSW